MEEQSNNHYYGIDWLRSIACVGIIMMHMISKDNNSYELRGFVYERVIPSFTDFVFTFMLISAFGMCCGYYKKVLDGSVNWAEFYKKRYLKILPFFSVLVILDLIINFSKDSLYEAIADLTLLYGLFPNEISVIGVGWFLGLIFAFYLIFPFFCVLIENKARAWMILIISLLMNYILGTYWGIGRNNIVYSFCFFLIGGLIYLYKEELVRFNFLFCVIGTIISIVIYYFIGGGVYTCLFVSVALLISAISVQVSPNKVISFISNMSMEIYLSHMLVFRGMEKMHLNTILGNGLVQYIFTTVSVLIGTVAFSYVMKKIFCLLHSNR